MRSPQFVARTSLLTASLLISLDSLASSQQTIENIRIGFEGDRTRFVFDLSAEANFQFSHAENAEAIVLELGATDSGNIAGSLWLRNTPVASIQRQISSNGETRYVLNLSRPVTSRTFALEGDGNHSYRVVLDLYPVAAGAESPQDSSGPAQQPQAFQETPSTALQPVATTAAAAQPLPDANAIESTRRRESPDSEIRSEWSGYVELEGRAFFHSPQYPGQSRNNVSVAFEPEYFREWDDYQQQFRFSPFARLDSADSERTHFDIRELVWSIRKEHYGLRLGIDTVFWGVTESQHLVDIINQTDLVEDIDGEDKLGQPMLNLSLYQAWGTLDFFVLPYFRERTFPGKQGRLRPPLPVDTDNPSYKSSKEEDHIDYALRWSHYIGDWDIGVAHFSGTSRAPLLFPQYNNGAITSITPFYDQIDQTSLDLQATIDAWLLKLEAVYNDNSIEDYLAYVGGFEYTWYGVFGGVGDMGFLAEYHYDQRDDFSATSLENDLYLGLRWTGNDHNNSELLAGMFFDTESNDRFFSLEAARRLGEYWTLSLEARLFQVEEMRDPLHYISEDDYLEISLARHF